MSRDIQQELVNALTYDSDGFCREWELQLNYEANLAGMDMRNTPVAPLKQFAFDIARIVEGLLTLGPNIRGEREPHRLPCYGGHAVGLWQAIEVFLIGEEVARIWVRRHIYVDDEDLLRLYEMLNRAFQQLIRHYVLEYCERCRAGNLAHSAEAMA